MEGTDLQIEAEKDNDITILRFNDNRLDSSKAPQIKTEFLKHLAEGSKHLLLNLEKVETADSSGLGALLFGLRQSNNSGGTLKLIALQPRVQSLIKISKLDRIFEIFDDEESCIKSIEK